MQARPTQQQKRVARTALDQIVYTTILGPLPEGPVVELLIQPSRKSFHRPTW